MDFPRGALPPGTGSTHRRKRRADDLLFTKVDEKKDDSEKKKWKKKKKIVEPEQQDKIIIENLKPLSVPVGMLVIGSIHQITDFEMQMLIPGGVVVSVPLYSISDTYSKTVEDFVADPSSTTPFKPQSMFEIGQCLPLKVLQKNEEGKGRSIKLIGSINPRDVNSEIYMKNLKSFASSMVISATVTQIEDHGYIMDLGMGDKMTGFLSAADAKEFFKRRPEMKRIPIGTVVMSAGLGISSRVMQLTLKSKVFKKNVITGDQDLLVVASLVPGMKVSARIMDIKERGLEIVAANELKGYIHKDHLTSEWDLPQKNYSIADIVEARVLYVHPASQLVACSLRELPTPETVQEKFSEFKKGSLVRGTVVQVDKFGVVLMSKKSKMKLVATSTNLADEHLTETEIVTMFPTGSKHNARVLNVNYFDGLVRVTLKPSDLAKEGFSSDEIVPGQIVTGKVKNLTPEGLYITIGSGVEALARNIHLVDAPQAAHPEKIYPLNKEVKCRILVVDKSRDRPRIHVTCKKSLLSKKLDILDTYEKANPGFETLGVVVMSNKSGVLLEFFGGLRGWISRILLQDYESIEDSFVKGQVVKCYVLSSDPDAERISLSLKPQKSAVTEEVAESEPEIIPENSKPKLIGSGQIVDCKVVKFEKDGVFFELEDSKVVRMSYNHVTDAQLINQRDAERIFKVGDKVKCRILEYSDDERHLILTMKPSLMDPEIETWRNVDKLQVGATTVGVISKFVNHFGRLVTFVGGVKGILPEKHIKTNPCGYKAKKLHVGEIVHVKIVSIHPSTKKVTLELIPKPEVITVTTKPITAAFALDNVAELGQEVVEEINNNEEEVKEDEMVNLGTIVNKIKSAREKEAEIREKETRMANLELDPQTEEEHERQVVSTPNSCMVWIEYISYLLECKQIAKARQVAERALKSINFRLEDEKFNIWIALINLEHFYGTKESLEAVIERAKQCNDPLKVNLRVAKMYQEAKETELAEKVFESMSKKFKHEKEFWIEFGMFNMKLNRCEAARKLMEQSLKSLPSREHLDVISKFGQMEFKVGNIEQGKSLFEKIVTSSPKRVDIWLIYLAMLIKFSLSLNPTSDQLEVIRNVFERVISLKLPAKRVNSIFNKWIEFEESFGNEKRVNEVKHQMSSYFEGNKLAFHMAE